jgi:hypothetical protein
MPANPVRRETPGDQATVVAVTAGFRATTLIVYPLAFAAGAWLLRYLAGWVATLPWAPGQEWFELAARVPEPWGTIGALALGVVAGLLLAALARTEEVAVTVGDDAAVIAYRGDSREIQRSAVTAVFIDEDDHLVLLGPAGEELARQGGVLPDVEKLEAAFGTHGYPWRAADPYEDQYVLWADGDDSADLPEGVDALMRARSRELERGGEGDAEEDADRLRAELGALGIVVRDKDKRQYWRRVHRTKSAESDVPG